MFYIFNKNNVCTGYCDNEPDKDDLSSREEFYIEDESLYLKVSNIVLNNGLLSYTEETSEEIATKERKKRNKELVKASNEIERLLDKGEDVTLWRNYRVLLRDLPEQEGFPLSITWPDIPTEYTGG